MRRLSVIVTLLLGLFLAMNAFGQDASLGGTVSDASGGVIAGATVTATNEGTGIASTSVTNSAGVYGFPRLRFGSYTVKAELKGFQPKTFTKVSLQVGQQARLNYQLEISGVATSVEITTTGEQLLLESSSTVGDVLPAKTVQELPLVNRNALDLIKVMSGVIVSDDPIFGANNTTFAGVSASAVNVQMDGATVNDVRYPTGINTPTRINPDMVGEFRMVLAPVDAEIGRGNAQVQIVTKAGGNAYHGSAVWNIQNTVFDPNTWNNNRLHTEAPWRNLQEYTISASGPIVKNKTFFFALFNGQVAKKREPYNAMSLTPCARKGIFRFWDRWNNGNILTTATTSQAGGANPVIATVDASGNPVRPQWEPNAWNTTAYTGQLRYASVFGTITNLSTLAADCSNAQVSGNWDPNRLAGMDPSGFIADFLQKLPVASNYDIGDGLNTAGYRWSRTAEGAENLYGVGEDTYRKEISVRIDHNFNPMHRINGSWSFEKDHADDTLKTWPQNSWSGGGIRQPQVLTVNFLSTFRPTLLNELKFGMSRMGSNIHSPNTRPSNGNALNEYLAQFGTLTNGEVGVVEPGSGLTGSFRTDGPAGTASTPYGTRGSWAIGDLIDKSPRYTYGDTLTWVKGTHSMRLGAEFRRNSSESQSAWLMNASFQWADSFPEYQGGELPLTPQTFTNVTGDLAGSSASSGNKRALRDLLIFLSGSLGQIKQARYINTIDATTWNNPIQEPHMVRDTIMKEFSLFAKDDWKIRPNLTLNLGVRWDYYGVPYLGNGMTVGLTGGGGAIFGPSGGYDRWFVPIARGDTPTGNLVSLRSIGPGGQHSGELLFPKTWTNVGPAVGFAYELPWLGKGKTTLRGGYQISYISANQFTNTQGAAGQSPGFFNINIWNNSGQWAANDYFGIKDLKTNSLFTNGVPIPSTVVPGLTTYTLYDRQQSVSAFAPNYRYPYIQNLTFAITRNVTSNLTVDLRYIGTLTRHNFSSKNINAPNFLTNGLLQAFNEARRGNDPVLLDQLLNGLALPAGYPTYATCTVNGTTCKGGAALRASNSPTYNLPFFAQGWFTNLNLMLAMGNYQPLANAFSVLSGPGTGYSSRGQYIETNGFPVDFIKPSAQFASATFYENQGYANYHSFQAEITLRPTHGIYFQSTYTWSKNMGNSGGLSPDPRDLSTGYIVQGVNRPHNWVTYGTFDFPFGPGRPVGGSTKGAVSRIIGGWQLGWITTVQSGAPLALTANCGLYGNCTPDLVNGGIDPKSVAFSWPNNAANGSLFANRYTFTRDPQCTDTNIVASGLTSLCTLQAVVDSTNGNIVLKNPLPGKMGMLGYNTYRNLTRWNVDLSVSKSVAITEGTSFRLRVDVTNVFNHPIASGTLVNSGVRLWVPQPPAMSINGTTPIGQYNYKVNGRTVQAMARFDF
jgi:hypothetical protein